MAVPKDTESPLLRKVGGRIKELRDERDLSQAALSRGEWREPRLPLGDRAGDPELHHPPSAEDREGAQGEGRQYHFSETIMDMTTAMETEGVLEDCIVVHDTLFASRWPKLFTPINFFKHALALRTLENRLKELQHHAGDTARSEHDPEGTSLLCRYIAELTDTMGRVRAICERQVEVAAASGSYKVSRYRRDCSDYEVAAAKHYATGLQLTTFIRQRQAPAQAKGADSDISLRAPVTPAGATSPPCVTQMDAAALLWNNLREAVYAGYPALYSGVRRSYPEFVTKTPTSRSTNSPRRSCRWSYLLSTTSSRRSRPLHPTPTNSRSGAGRAEWGRTPGAVRGVCRWVGQRRGASR